MSGELKATLGTILTVGVAIAGLILASFSSLRSDMASLRSDMTMQREATRSLSERMARLEGLLEGRRESSVSATSAAAPEGADTFNPPAARVAINQ